jgi:hypothetical protein
MGTVLDPRLVGYWSDEALYQGAMEAADIAFRPDGTGWTYWSRDGGTFYVDRFSWHARAGPASSGAMPAHVTPTPGPPATSRQRPARKAPRSNLHSITVTSSRSNPA